MVIIYKDEKIDLLDFYSMDEFDKFEQIDFESITLVIISKKIEIRRFVLKKMFNKQLLNTKKDVINELVYALSSKINDKQKFVIVFNSKGDPQMPFVDEGRYMNPMDFSPVVFIEKDNVNSRSTIETVGLLPSETYAPILLFGLDYSNTILKTRAAILNVFESCPRDMNNVSYHDVSLYNLDEVLINSVKKDLSIYGGAHDVSYDLFNLSNIYEALLEFRGLTGVIINRNSIELINEDMFFKNSEGILFSNNFTQNDKQPAGVKLTNKLETDKFIDEIIIIEAIINDSIYVSEGNMSISVLSRADDMLHVQHDMTGYTNYMSISEFFDKDNIIAKKRIFSLTPF